MSGADPAALERERVGFAARCSLDPLAFVNGAFPWGQGELAGFKGPDEWQADVLDGIGRKLRAGHAPGASLAPVREAVASGHGIGKSTLVAWLILWALVTREDTRAVVTANTENQLTGKTWPEVAKWHRLCLWRSWFEMTATALASTDPERARTWRADAIPWSETRTEAFAGLHNAGRRILLVFDEASAIPDTIWQVAEGALTDRDTEILWLAFGNPTRNTGRFRECFGRFKHRWSTRHIDARSVRITNKEQIAEWQSDHGEHSDFFKVRVRGQFPSAGSAQFVPSALVEAATKRPAEALLTDALVLGVDVARFGDDQSVIWFRKGRDARSIPPVRLRGVDLMQFAGRVVEEAARHHADAIFVDGTGVGGGVVDRLHQLRVQGVHEVQFGAKPVGGFAGGEMARVRNRRAEMWLAMRVWLERGAIPDDAELIADLTGPEFGYDVDGAIVMEGKAEMKRRGLASPDLADALALTLAFPVGPSRRSGGIWRKPRERAAYNPHGEFEGGMT